MDINQRLPASLAGVKKQQKNPNPFTIQPLNHVCKMFAFTPLLRIFHP